MTTRWRHWLFGIPQICLLCSCSWGLSLEHNQCLNAGDCEKGFSCVVTAGHGVCVGDENLTASDAGAAVSPADVGSAQVDHDVGTGAVADAGTPDGETDDADPPVDLNEYCNYGEYYDTAALQCASHNDKDLLCQYCDPYDAFACEENACLFDGSVPRGLSCSANADCMVWPGAVCSSTPCYSNADCPGGSDCDGASSLFGQNFPGTCATGSCSRGFCGSDECNDDNARCPRGYQCYPLISITGSPCTLNGNQCQGGRACQAHGENEVSGFCSCISDDDCGGLLSGLTCSNPGPEGICISGTTCGPSNGFSCDDLKQLQVD